MGLMTICTIANTLLRHTHAQIVDDKSKMVRKNYFIRIDLLLQIN